MWLVPVYTTNKSKACNGFRLVIESEPDTDTAKWHKNLAKGSVTEKFRYLVPTYPEKTAFNLFAATSERVRKVVLIREHLNGHEDGGFWDGRTGDINEGRLGLGDYLYLAWSLA